MELHELHVLDRQTGAQHHGVAVAGLGVRASARGIDATVAAGGEHSHLRGEAMNRTVLKIERNDAATAPVVVDNEIDGEVFDEELGRMAQRLAVHRVQHGVAGAVGGGAGALRGALPPFFPFSAISYNAPYKPNDSFNMP